MQLIAKAILVVVGIVHLLPATGVLGAAHLTRLYGLSFDEPNLAVLMRHRAVLFGLVGLFLIYAVWRSDLTWLAILAGLVSTVSFVWLAWAIGETNAAISRVAVVDLVAIACLLAAATIEAIR